MFDMKKKERGMQIKRKKKNSRWIWNGKLGTLSHTYKKNTSKRHMLWSRVWAYFSYVTNHIFLSCIVIECSHNKSCVRAIDSIEPFVRLIRLHNLFSSTLVKSINMLYCNHHHHSIKLSSFKLSGVSMS